MGRSQMLFDRNLRRGVRAAGPERGLLGNGQPIRLTVHGTARRGEDDLRVLCGHAGSDQSESRDQVLIVELGVRDRGLGDGRRRVVEHVVALLDGLSEDPRVQHVPTEGIDAFPEWPEFRRDWLDRKSTRLNSSHGYISYAVFCLKKKKKSNVQRE